MVSLVTFSPAYAQFSGVRTIGYVGCSNTQDAMIGYQSVVTNVTQKKFWNPYPTVGGTLDRWADNSTNKNTAMTYWAEYSQQIVTYGQPSIVWIQICEDTKVQVTPTMVSQVLDILRTLSRNAIFYISPLNTYSPVGFCSITGPNGVQDATTLTNQAVSEVLALQGPILGPLDSQTTISDGCHANAAGRQLLGTQLQAFFNDTPLQQSNPVPELNGIAMVVFSALGASVYILRKRVNQNLE